MKIAVISSSLNPSSRSRLLATFARDLLDAEEGIEVDWIDLQELELPLCDGGAAYGSESAIELNTRMEAADAYVIATPIYNYTINAALKNLVELGGRKMENKLVGFLCAAGGSMSYMSVMSLANSLMLDFRCIVLPRFVYATGEDWDGEALKESLSERLKQFAAHFAQLAGKLVD